MDYPKPLVTVDAVLLTLKDGVLQVALHSRPQEPFKGRLALPGGFVRLAEDVDATAAVYRVLQEKTGFTPSYLEQLQTFSGLLRDPREWSISLAYLALVPLAALTTASDVFRFYPVDHLPELAFDHNEIVRAAVTRVRSKSSYSALPVALLPELFTLTQLQATYEAVLQTKLDKSSFRRKIDVLDVVEATPHYQEGAQRPAQYYKLKNFSTFDRQI